MSLHNPLLQPQVIMRADTHSASTNICEIMGHAHWILAWYHDRIHLCKKISPFPECQTFHSGIILNWKQLRTYEEHPASKRPAVGPWTEVRSSCSQAASNAPIESMLPLEFRAVEACSLEWHSTLLCLAVQWMSLLNRMESISGRVRAVIHDHQMVGPYESLQIKRGMPMKVTFMYVSILLYLCNPRHA